SRRDRQGELLREPRRLSHAGAEKSGCARPAILQCRRQITAARRPERCPIQSAYCLTRHAPVDEPPETRAWSGYGRTLHPLVGDMRRRATKRLRRLPKRRGDLFRRISALSAPFCYNNNVKQPLTCPPKPALGAADQVLPTASTSCDIEANYVGLLRL